MSSGDSASSRSGTGSGSVAASHWHGQPQPPPQPSASPSAAPMAVSHAPDAATWAEGISQETQGSISNQSLHPATVQLCAEMEAEGVTIEVRGASSRRATAAAAAAATVAATVAAALPAVTASAAAALASPSFPPPWLQSRSDSLTTVAGSQTQTQVAAASPAAAAAAAAAAAVPSGSGSAAVPSHAAAAAARRQSLPGWMEDVPRSAAAQTAACPSPRVAVSQSFHIPPRSPLPAAWPNLVQPGTPRVLPVLRGPRPGDPPGPSTGQGLALLRMLEAQNRERSEADAAAAQQRAQAQASAQPQPQPQSSAPQAAAISAATAATADQRANSAASAVAAPAASQQGTTAAAAAASAAPSPQPLGHPPSSGSSAAASIFAFSTSTPPDFHLFNEPQRQLAPDPPADLKDMDAWEAQWRAFLVHEESLSEAAPFQDLLHQFIAQFVFVHDELTEHLDTLMRENCRQALDSLPRLCSPAQREQALAKARALSDEEIEEIIEEKCRPQLNLELRTTLYKIQVSWMGGMAPSPWALCATDCGVDGSRLFVHGL